MREIAEVMQDIQAELVQIGNLSQELDALQRLNYKGIHRAQGSILHDFYTGCERIFLRIAGDIDQDIPQGDRWHIELLERMQTEYGEVRPEVISDDLALSLRPYLGFRHVFRNIYGFELQVERLHPLVENFSLTMDHFQTDLKRFLDFLKKMRDSL